MAAEPLWTLDRVSLDTARMREVSLEIGHGVTAVLGGSGAGKSALLNLLAGFAPPPGGQLLRVVGGAARTKTPPAVAWVPQNDGLWPHCTAREHLALVGGSPKNIERLLAAFDLGAKADLRPGELSPAEQSCLAVARALAVPASVLLLDEPFARVDPERRATGWRVVREHLAANGASLVFATRVPETALAIASRVIGLRDGQGLCDGPVAELYAAPPTAEVMNLFGPGNWLNPDEIRLWLGLRAETERCFRPEQIEVEPAPVSHLVVRQSAFLGSMAETELRHINAAQVRTFLHRPSGPNLFPGTPAVVRWRE